MQTFVQLGSKKWFISSLDRGKSMRYIIYQLFKDKKISKSIIYQTIKDCKNGLTCVVKSKFAKSRVADNKKIRNLLQSIKKPRESVVTACGQENQHHTFYSFSKFEKKKTMSKFLRTRQSSSRKFLVADAFCYCDIFVTKK
jgi:hypothetical protein